MGKAAKKKLTTTDDVVQRKLAALGPKQQFLSAAMNMGWQLGGVVLIPVIIGVKLDDRFHSSPSYTLAALVIASGGAIAVVRNVISQVVKEQKEQDDK